MRKFIALCTVALIASGCGTIQTRDVETSVIYACSAATIALETASAFFEDLSPDQRNTINQARLRTDPVCLQEGPVTLEGTARIAFDVAIQDLVRTQQEIESDG